MAENQKESKEHYHRAREEFDGLKIEDKAVFLVESAVTMLTQGIQSVGKVFSSEMDKMFEHEEEEEAEVEAKPKPKTKKTTRRRPSSSAKSSRKPADSSDD